jgi:hypothetical protein
MARCKRLPLTAVNRWRHKYFFWFFVGYRTDKPPLSALLFGSMASFRKPDPELLPLGRPRCPACSTRMLTVAIRPGPEGFEHRTFECLRCGHTEKKILACDPLRSSAVGWLAGELHRPT